MTNLRTCSKCKRVAFGVSRQYAVAQAIKFSKFIRSIYGQQVAEHYGITNPTEYKQDWFKTYGMCSCGAEWNTFKDFKPGDCPDGCTLSPIIYRKK